MNGTRKKSKRNKNGKINTNSIAGRILSAVILSAFILSAAVFGIADFIVPEEITVFSVNDIGKNNLIVYSQSDGDISSYALASMNSRAFNIPGFQSASQDYPKSDGDEIYTAKLFGLIPIKKVQVNIFPQTSLIPGGMPFGVKFFTDGVVVVGISDIETEKGTANPAKTAGIKTSDIITAINGNPVSSVEEVAQIIESGKGETLKLSVQRDSKTLEIKLKPVYSVTEKKYKSGIWLRDSTAGIGTVTFISPSNYAFGGLGHGICDVDTGNLMPLKKGTIVNAAIENAVKGKPDLPGELKGKFKENMGTLLANTNNGIFGIFNNIPMSYEKAVAIPVGLRSDIKEGKAIIYSTVDESGVCEFEIEIIKIYKNSNDSKNFLIKITDPELLEITGGIVQGMSGSPIIQNGKIIGAVTHVLVSDPTKGYGIFMENMFSSMPDVLK